MKKDKNSKIRRYHFDEIVLILLILASELSKYNEDDLMSFSESIEGRIEILFTKEFLSSINKEFGINDTTILDLEYLKAIVTSIYEPQWINKIKESNHRAEEMRHYASKILAALKINNNDPKKFSEDHLNIDW